MASLLPNKGGALKSVRRILPSPPRHWVNHYPNINHHFKCDCTRSGALTEPANAGSQVGNGFHVFPVFHDLAFSEELSPWLMFDYAAPKKFGPTVRLSRERAHASKSAPRAALADEGERG